MTPTEREAIERLRSRATPYRYHDACIVLSALDKAEVEIARLREALKKADGDFRRLAASIAVITEGRGE